VWQNCTKQSPAAAASLTHLLSGCDWPWHRIGRQIHTTLPDMIPATTHALYTALTTCSCGGAVSVSAHWLQHLPDPTLSAVVSTSKLTLPGPRTSSLRG